MPAGKGTRRASKRRHVRESVTCYVYDARDAVQPGQRPYGLEPGTKDGEARWRLGSPAGFTSSVWTRQGQGVPKKWGSSPAQRTDDARRSLGSPTGVKVECRNSAGSAHPLERVVFR